MKYQSADWHALGIGGERKPLRIDTAASALYTLTSGQ